MTVRLATLILAASFAALAFTSSRQADSVTASDFSPSFVAQIDDLRPGTSSDIVVSVTIPAENVDASVIGFSIPAEWGVTSGQEIAAGLPLADVDANMTFGLLNSACNQLVPIEFELVDASVDPSETVSFGDSDQDFIADIAEDVNGNGLPDGVDRYPDTLNTLFPGLEPDRRAAGITIIAGVPTLFQVVTFPPGVDLPGSSLGDGYASYIVYHDQGDPERPRQPDAITDICTPVTWNLRLFGEAEGGQDLFTNPSGGVRYFQWMVTGLPDADDDGFENRLDTCPLSPNIGSPKVTNDGDLDFDGLDASCDPSDSLTDSDVDADGYINRQDNCPLVQNAPGQSIGHSDVDLDDIGDACDPNPNLSNGASATATGEQAIEINEGEDISGDVDCDGDVDPLDALKILRADAGLNVELPAGCPQIGT
jgi:hypothetical protein